MHTVSLSKLFKSELIFRRWFDAWMCCTQIIRWTKKERDHCHFIMKFTISLYVDFRSIKPKLHHDIILRLIGFLSITHKETYSYMLPDLFAKFKISSTL
jgi:hypothetical protein